MSDGVDVRHLLASLRRLQQSGLISSQVDLASCTEASLLSELGIDSLARLTLLVELEAVVDSDLDPSLFAGAKTVGDVAEVMQRAKRASNDSGAGGGGRGC
jgi:acyl carrier protein